MGVDLIQIREKDLATRDLAVWVRQAVEWTRGQRPSQPRVLVNDRLDVALACSADGVHLPGSGLPIASVRQVCPRGFLIGVSTHSVRDVVSAERQGADLVVFGPVFETSSKPHLPGVGLDALREAAHAVQIPVLALGGVTARRVPEVVGAGASGVAGISVFYRPAGARRVLKSLKE